MKPGAELSGRTLGAGEAGHAHQHEQDHAHDAQAMSSGGDPEQPAVRAGLHEP